LFQRKKRVSCRACEKRASRSRLETRVSNALCGAQAGDCEARKRERVTRKVSDRPEELVLEVVPAGDEGLE
jgi:hypothetical protein